MSYQPRRGMKNFFTRKRIIIGTAMIIGLSVFASFSRVYYLKSHIAADSWPSNSSVAAYQLAEVNPLQVVASNTVKINNLSGFMGWWTIARSGKMSGYVDFGQIDSQTFDSTWSDVVSIYPHFFTLGASISMKVCASDIAANMTPNTELIDQSKGSCAEYAFEPMSNNPWSFKFAPTGAPVKGRYARLRLKMTTYSPLMPQIPVRMTAEVQRSLYSGVVDFINSDISFASSGCADSGLHSTPMLMLAAAQDLQAMAAEYRQKMGQPLPLTSGFRDKDFQKCLVDNGYAANDPCKSWHQAGLAVDLNLDKIGKANYAYIHDLALKYHWEIDQYEWGADEDHHIDYLPGQSHFNGSAAAAINAANGEAICPAV
jgi:hypothetical protein